MEHHFNIELARETSIECAIIFNNLCFWVDKNKANNKHYHDGRYWTYNSVSAFCELFPYMTKHKIIKALNDLETRGYIVTGNYNKSGVDRTKWYSVNQQMHLLEIRNANAEKRKPIPYSKPDNKPDKEIVSEQSSDDTPLLNLDVTNQSLEIKITKSFFDLFRKIQEENGVTVFTKYDKTKLKSWLVHVKRMIELDKVTLEDLREVHVWLSDPKFKNSEFWRKNIISTQKLREQFPKLQSAMKDDLKALSKNKPQRNKSRLGL